MERLQSRYRWALRALALLTLLGLGGMHGLPDAMATPSGAPAMHSGASLSAPHVRPAHAGEPAPTLRADRVGVAQPARRSSQSADGSVAGPVGCSMGHAGCVAVLRDAGQLTPAAAVLGVAVTPVMPRSALVTSPGTGPRAPPDVSLIGLGISRT